MAIGIICGWGLRQGGQKCRFGERQILGMFGKIGAGRSFDTIGVITQKNLIEIECEYFILAQLLFQSVGKNNFLDFALITLFRGKHETLHHLLGDGTASACLFSRFDIGDHGADYGFKTTPGCL